MSPKKKPTPTKSAPKDDLIDALYESESVGNAALKNSQKSQTQTETVSRLSEFERHAQKRSGARPPPPPPPADDGDRIYNFDDPTRSVPTTPLPQTPRGEGSIPTFESPESQANLELEELKTVVHAVDSNDSTYPGRDASKSLSKSQYGVSRLSEAPAPPSSSDDEDVSDYGNISVVVPDIEAQYEDVREKSGTKTPAPARISETTPPPAASMKPGDKLQKLEDVLRRLKPQFPSKKSGPLYDSDTANAAMAAHKESPAAKELDAIAPPPNKPVGVVAKAVDSNTNSDVSTESDVVERAPTSPVPSSPVSIDPNLDEKTVAAQETPAPRARAVESARPVWQDAKTEILSQMTDTPESDPEAEQFMPTEIRPNSPGARFREEARQAQPGAAIFSSAEAALRQSENLRVAQKRISDLENELERVRRENESLRSAGDTLRRRMDELQANAEAAELNTQEAKKIAEEERKVLKGQIQSRDREISDMKGRIDDAENRLESNFRKIRVRERDLEHRIEIIKAESQSIAASKDRMILELKRQIDQISSELSHSKAQVQETFGQFKEKQETARRAVRALRIALTVLEGEEDSGSRKAE